MQAKAPVRRRNALLDHLSDHDFAILEPKLRPATLEFRKSLQQTDRRITTAYFPESGIASTVTTTGPHRQQTDWRGALAVGHLHPG